MISSVNHGRSNPSGIESQVFVIEVQDLPSTVESSTFRHIIRKIGRSELTVPYSRMSREIRRIALQGRKIIGVRPLHAHTGADDSSKSKLAWWLHVSTQQPNNQYYFGPFETALEAESNRAGYIEDLRQEGATNIISEVKHCQPEKLTISESCKEGNAKTWQLSRNS